MKGQKTYEAALIKLNEYIAAHRMRKSRVREMVLEQACQIEQPFTAEQLAQACAAERISLGTVYNALELFITAQILHAINRQRGKGFTQYEVIPGKQAHIQIRCGKCGRIADIRDKAIDSLVKVHKFTNFEMRRYSLIIYGECKHCLKTRKRNKEE
jgi:Fe2+ or Zn2+ uptake regulation protein